MGFGTAFSLLHGWQNGVFPCPSFTKPFTHSLESDQVTNHFCFGVTFLLYFLAILPDTIGQLAMIYSMF